LADEAVALLALLHIFVALPSLTFREKAVINSLLTFTR
jgi:hypothetical protein